MFSRGAALNRLLSVSCQSSKRRVIVAAHRSKSSSAAAAANKCPITGSGGDATDNSQVKLRDVPKLPFLGSIIPQYSGVNKFDLSATYDWWYSSYRKFGGFYCFVMPGMGKGLFGTTYVMTDPNEYMKVLRKEGQHPFGAVMTEWPFVKYYKDGGDQPGMAAGRALFSQGESWQRIRRFMQTDLLSPNAAKGYVPGMIKACETASQGAPLHAKNINEYAAQCSFDMFSSIVFGEFPGLAGNGKKEEQDEEFCTSSINALELILPMMIDPKEMMQHLLGMKSSKYSTFEANFAVARKIASQKIENFKERKANGELLNDFEKNSYAGLAIDRYLSSAGEEGALEEEDVGEIIMVALIAALDTTSAMLNWCIVHLAMNPNVQEELFKEISSNITAEGNLTADYFSKSNSAYLNAVLRENHRITPPIALNLTKENVTGEIEIHDVTLPKQSMVVLDTRSLGMDPNVVKDPDTFDPSRWFDEEQVKGRKGTSAEVLDHPLYREPFSAGARKCPGSRVANYEAKVMLSQLVLDWKISLASDDQKIESWRDVPYFNGLTVQPTVPELSFEKRH